ncbi:hypothetical protein GE061_004288 [Apolygus lucorum]|uniref:Uncharacterized protein n=1 Tax=Apolygus lucorum TaxID=248454 RepID=A0A8S9WYS2_APOLU|nr:hypothetical protein GE061_004288 [Apolygus lucorum]
MEDGCVVKEEPMSEEDATEDQLMEEAAIKQEVLIRDESVKEEDVNSWTVKDEVEGYLMIKREGSSTDDCLSDENDVLQGSIGVQKSEAGPAFMEDGRVVKEEPMSEEEATEDQLMEEAAIKQEALIGDESVKEAVMNSWTVKDEVEGYLMIKREEGSTDDCLSDENDVLQGSIGVQKSEAGPASVNKEEDRREKSARGRPNILIRTRRIPMQTWLTLLLLSATYAATKVMEDESVVKEEQMSDGEATEDQLMEEAAIKQEVLIGDESVKEEDVNSWTVKDEVEGYLMIKREDSSTDDCLGDENDVLQGSIGVQKSEAGPAYSSDESSWEEDSDMDEDYDDSYVPNGNFF